jgi:nicotinamide mononucleotide transporter
MDRSLRKTFDIKNWNAFERLWVVVFLLAGTVVTVLTKASLLNYFILITGVFCVILAAKGNIWSYAFGLINSLAYG